MKWRLCGSATLVLLIALRSGLIAGESPEPDHSEVPGVVISHSPAASGIYIGSPGIVVLPDGAYLAKHDQFGPRSTEKDKAITCVYRSTDRGRSWKHASRVERLFWANIFCHQGAVYMMGTSATHGHGHCVIRKSTDNGRTWSEARDENSGLLFGDLSYHTAPMPMIVHRGRIWRAMEDEKGGNGWGHSFRAFVMSAPVDADLLKASSWTASNALARDPSYLNGKFFGWLEGNAVVDLDGQVVDILRVNVEGGSRIAGKAAMIRISEDGRRAFFDPETGFIDFPGGATKFTIRYDPKSKAYWSLTNPAIGGSVRNTLALLRSEDLRNWEMRCILLHHPDKDRHAFQYPDWVFEADDIIAAIRTAYDDGLGGAHRGHDANYLTFHRFESFRELTMADSVVDPKTLKPPGPVKIDLGVIVVEGQGFTLQTLQEGSQAFGNRDYVWTQVPEKLRGWHYTQTFGGQAAQIAVVANHDATVHFATATSQEGIETNGWQPDARLAFCYTDSGRTGVQVFKRVVKAGQRVEIPQGNWTGGILLVGPEKSK